MKHIKSLNIKNSPLFKDLKIDFSKKMNCIMGGRGTGKTTLLIFLKAALEEDIESQSNAFSLLRNNLKNGIVEVKMEVQSGETYTISKSVNDFPQPEINDEHVDFDRIKDHIKCDFYETNEIVSIGIDPYGRLDLIDKKVFSKINEKKKRIRQIQIDLNSNAQEIRSNNAHLKELQDSLNNYEKVEKEFKEHKKKKPDGLKKNEKEEFESADKKEKQRTAEKRVLDSLLRKYKGVSKEVNSIKTNLNEFYANIDKSEKSYHNQELLSKAINIANELNGNIADDLSKIFSNIESKLNELAEIKNDLNEKHATQQAEFVKLKQKFEESREYIDKYNSLTTRIDKKKQIQKEISELEKKVSKVRSIRLDLIRKLNDFKDDIFQIRREVVDKLNKLFEGEIIIRLSAGGLTEIFEEKLREALVGSGLRYNQLIPNIVDNFTPDNFARIIHERDVKKLSSASGIDSSRSETLLDALYESKEIYDIEKLYLPDLPEFLLKVKRVDDSSSHSYRETESLSMGQRCTTILPIIFSVSKNPLIIDQPEDNLDNKYIANNIHEIIREQKEERQLIFITHNPNIPVLSNSEKNIFLDYKEKSFISSTGRVDEVKNDIIDLLEGGEKAFERRRKIYGF